MPSTIRSSSIHFNLTSLFTLLFMLLTHLVQAQSSNQPSTISTTVTAPTPTAATEDPAAPPPVDPNDTTGWSVVIIDKQWTQLFIGMSPIVGAVIVLGSVYSFLWVPWWTAKMKEVEKEYNRLEKERMGGATGRA